jgi:hypothetical protein
MLKSVCDAFAAAGAVLFYDVQVFSPFLRVLLLSSTDGSMHAPFIDMCGGVGSGIYDEP